jgi:hypothetical protein
MGRCRCLEKWPAAWSQRVSDHSGVAMAKKKMATVKMIEMRMLFSYVPNII